MRVQHVKPICGVPGCGRALTSHNTSGVCVLHNHAAGYCGCGQCRRKGRAPAAAPDPRPAVAANPALKQVEVPYPTSNSGVKGTKKITLEKFPWEGR